MKFTTLGFSAILAFCSSTAAFAQDEWSGAYVGVSVGAVHQPGDSNERLVFDRDLDGAFDDTVTTALGADAFLPGFCEGEATTTTNTACRADNEGADVGVRVGYDWQTGPWVFGLVGDITVVDAEDSVAGFSSTPASYTFTRKANIVSAARFRVGRTLGSYLLYGMGGFAYADVEHRFIISNTTNAFNARNDDTLNGYQWGAGVERKLNDNVSLSLEYLFTTLDDKNYTVRATRGTAAPTNPFVLPPNATGTDIRRSESDFEFGSIRIGASYRFR